MRLALAMVCLISAAVAPAKADKIDEPQRRDAKRRFEVGAKLYNLRSYERALAEFREVYLATGDPRLLFNIGQCERQLGRRKDAQKSYRAFLREANPGPAQVAETERLIAALDALEKETSARVPPEAPAPALAPALAPAPAPSRSISAATDLARQAAPPPRSRAWVYGVIAGSVVVVGLGVGLGLGFGLRAKDPTPSQGFVTLMPLGL